MNILVTGSRGFLGSFIVPDLLAAGHSISVLSRAPAQEKRPNVKAFQWNPVDGPPPAESLQNADAIIHLAGEGIAHKWSDELKKKIRDSRVIGTRNLVNAIALMSVKPKALICSSATGYYGDRGEEELTEASSPGSGFLAEVCVEWEREADGASALGLRVVKMRTGMVLATEGGALARLLSAFKSKMGGKLGSGKQWMSWIHIADIVALYRFCVENKVTGVLNGTSPNPVRNEDFTEALAAALHQPAKLAVPEFALKMLFGEMSEVMLGSQKVIPEATERAGYSFEFPVIASALDDCVKGI